MAPKITYLFKHQDNEKRIIGALNIFV